MYLNFTKMHGLGNDFIVIDSLSQAVDLNSEKIKFLANRNLGVGCDQVLIIEPPKKPNVDFNYRIFNSDGNEVQQCGNGARCLGKYVSDKKLTAKEKILVSTINREILITILDNKNISVEMGVPEFEPKKIPFIINENVEKKGFQYKLKLSNGDEIFTPVSMGNPHAVLTTDNIDIAPVNELGQILEKHPNFPDRVNVIFMQTLSRNQIKIRVFERGVGETQACGSGACAAVAAGIKNGHLDHKVKVSLSGGELNIYWASDDSSLVMSGTASTVFEGRIKL